MRLLQDALESIVELREHDVPYHVRFAIDTDVRCGHWFVCKAKGGKVSLERRPDLLARAEPRICAFDIGAGAAGAGCCCGGVAARGGRGGRRARECGGCRPATTVPPRPHSSPAETTKLPLQFPNAEYDQVRVGALAALRSQHSAFLSTPPCPALPRAPSTSPQIFMISYMVDRQGYLIINREVGGRVRRVYASFVWLHIVAARRGRGRARVCAAQAPPPRSPPPPAHLA